MNNLHGFAAMGGHAVALALATSLAGCAVAQSPSSAASPVPHSTERPNILFIFTDDQRQDTFGAVGNPVIETPNLDRLINDGIWFENSFVTTSICCVNRACILTGEHSVRHGVHDFFQTLTNQQLRETYAGVLREQGYYTGFIGKWGIGDSVEATARGAQVFDFWAGASHQTNFWHEADCPYVLNDGVTNKTDNTCTCPPDARGIDGPRVRIGKANIEDPVHLETEVFVDKFEDFLDTRDPDKPFHYSAFFKSPHSPFSDYPDETAHLYVNAKMPIPWTATPGHADARPEFMKNHLGNPTGQRQVDDHEVLSNFLREYYRLVTGIDITVGKMVEALEERGLADNTVILYTSDNGYFSGEQGYAGKWLMYEPSLRVPGFYYDPRLPRELRGQRLEHPVVTIDFSVTMLDLAGAPVPGDMQGMSFAQLAANPDVPWREDFYYEHRYDHGGQIKNSEGVWSKEWKYVLYPGEDPPVEQLFHLTSDPDELNDLWGDPAHAAVREQMRARWEYYKVTTP